jgi:phosphatidate cytidylyltransferase
MLKKRVLTALLGIPLIAIVIWFGNPWFTILVAIWGALAVLEFYRIAAINKLTLFTYFGIIWTVLFIISQNSDIISIIEPYINLNLITPLMFTLLVVLSLILLLVFQQKEKAFLHWVWTLGGIIYIGWLLSHLIALRELNYGKNWVFYALFTTFTSDTFSFFIGHKWGKHQLASTISPSKTWEGAIAGIISATAFSLLFIPLTPFSLYFSYGQAMLLGLMVSIFGQLGDLIESLFKRNMGVKESGKLVPGHGGILDRTDSIIFASVFVYYYAIIL